MPDLEPSFTIEPSFTKFAGGLKQRVEAGP